MRQIKRREFLAYGAGLLAWPSLSRAAPRAPASERIGLGLIGAGDLGRNHHLRWALEQADVQVRAVCDVDAEHLAEAVKMTDGKARAHRDFRALLDDRDVDAVIIVTPDHWHALNAIHACMAGKDVYCEKPLSYSIGEGRAMVRAARRYGRVFQTGSQQRSSFDFRWACDLVRNGRIGTLHKVTVCIGEGPTCDYEPNQPAPTHLDWDFWLGPAPWQPYTPKRCHYTFRWFYDYSGGKVTDWGAHHLDIAQWALGTDHSGPREIEGEAVLPVSGLYDTAVTFAIDYRYDNGVVVHCTSSGENGVTFSGSDGEIFVSRSRIGANPPEILDTEPGTGAVPLHVSNDHRRNWLDCLRTRARPICDVEIGHRSATVCHLGNIAIRLDRTLRWDATAERFVGDEEANRMLSRPMRDPWSL